MKCIFKCVFFTPYLFKCVKFAISNRQYVLRETQWRPNNLYIKIKCKCKLQSLIGIIKN